MRLPKGQATNMIAIATGMAFLVVMLTPWADIAPLLGGFVPARITHPALFADVTREFWAVPAWLTPLTATLLHGGWLHIGFNLVVLLFCGRQVEQVIGPRLLVLLYICGAYFATAGQWVLDPQGTVPMIGASGAISALLGAYALLYSNRQVRAIGPIPAHVVRMAWLGAGWVFIQALVALAGMGAMQDNALSLGNIAVGAHVGGFLAGMVMTRPLLRWRFRRPVTGIGD